jgi:hypothetical protein
MRRIWIAGLFWAAAGAAAAFAFGTDEAKNGLGSEHSRITRAALDGLGALTLDRLAGKAGEAGAVGVPDRLFPGPSDETPQHRHAHCDGGDYLAPTATGGEEYFQTEAEAAAEIAACRELIREQIELAVAAAKPLKSPATEDLTLDCRWNGDNAKCAVLYHLGLAFHAAQDFYARTNWVDRAAPGATTPENPPGLGHAGRAPWLDLRNDLPFPAGLISGCPEIFTVLGGTVGCEYGDYMPVAGSTRISRAALNKDLGPVGGGRGGSGTTPRGRVEGNFARAVAAAIEDTKDKWAFFKERLAAQYGKHNAAMIVCAIERDDADKAACWTQVTHAEKCEAREILAGDPSDASFVEPDAGEIAGAEILWEQLRTSCRTEESDVARSAVMAGGKGEAGRASAKAEAVKSLARWAACPDQLRRQVENSSGRTAQGKTLEAHYAQCVLSARLRQLEKSRR